MTDDFCEFSFFIQANAQCFKIGHDLFSFHSQKSFCSALHKECSILVNSKEDFVFVARLGRPLCCSGLPISIITCLPMALVLAKAVY
jgi:hypothetical protein